MRSLSAKLTPRSGYTPVAGNLFGLKYISEFGILDLPAGDSHSGSSGDQEMGFLVFSGTCRVEIDGNDWGPLGRRSSVFAGLPQALYLPPGHDFSITGGPVQLGICGTGAKRADSEPRLITADDIKVMDVGKDNWSREVRLIIPPGGFSENLVMGETINPPGNWSGTPPHKHEVDETGNESLHEELYYFLVDKEQGWGMQRTYSPERGVNELIYLEQDTLTFMPWGYHQVVAAPGYTLYYMFCLAGKGNTLTGKEDTDHNWIKADA